MQGIWSVSHPMQEEILQLLQKSWLCITKFQKTAPEWLGQGRDHSTTRTLFSCWLYNKWFMLLSQPWVSEVKKAHDQYCVLVLLHPITWLDLPPILQISKIIKEILWSIPLTGNTFPLLVLAIYHVEPLPCPLMMCSFLLNYLIICFPFVNVWTITIPSTLHMLYMNKIQERWSGKGVKVVIPFQWARRHLHLLKQILKFQFFQLLQTHSPSKWHRHFRHHILIIIAHVKF